MRYFPQLSTGAIGQYPIEKRRVARTVVNEAADGVRVKLADAAAMAVEWTLAFETLSDAERAAIEDLHIAVEGRLGTFTFLDPTDNLLCWSEKLDEAAWERNLLLTVELGVGDPNGGTSAARVTNTGSAALAIQQTVNAPGWFHYAFGLQARSDENGQVTLARSAGAESQSKSFSVGDDWRRIVLSGNLAGAEESVTFGIEIAAGQTVDLYGIQAEAQAGASGYKSTFSPCGVYPLARFMDDELAFTAVAPNQHSCVARIRARS